MFALAQTYDPAILSDWGTFGTQGDAAKARELYARASLAATMRATSFKACGNTQENMGRAENKKIGLIPQAAVVESGAIRAIELQEQAWSYVRAAKATN